MRRITKGVLALIGAVLFLCAITVLAISGIFSSAPLPGSGEPTASSTTDPSCRVVVEGAKVGDITQQSGYDMKPDNLVMTQNENMVLALVAKPQEGDARCLSYVLVSGPDFSISPQTGWSMEATDTTPSRQPFILSPMRTGEYTISVFQQGSSGFSTTLYNVSVGNWMGLSPLWSQVFVGIGTIFGPMLTVPWWLDRRRESKEKFLEGTTEPRTEPEKEQGRKPNATAPPPR